MTVIRSKHNPRVRHLRHLLTKKGRLAAREFVMEGRELTDEALRASALSWMVVDGERSGNEGLAQRAREQGVEVLVVSPEVMRHLSSAVTPPGVAGVCSFIDRPLDEILSASTRLACFLYAPKDPGNLGTLIRSAAAAGCDAVTVGPAAVDLYNPKTVRATMGAIFRVPVALGVRWEDMVRAARARELALCALDVAGDQSIYEVDLRPPSLLVLGSEVLGLPEELLSACDLSAHVPLAAGVDSLNLAVAGALALFEARRQRLSTGA